MSGGHYNYASHNINTFIYVFGLQANTPLRLAFLNHLKKVEKAIHDIEWVDSGDYGPGDEDAAIKEALGDNWKTLSVEAAIEKLDELRVQLQDLIKD